jgi:predicted dehydrogenase
MGATRKDRPVSDGAGMGRRQFLRRAAAAGAAGWAFPYFVPSSAFGAAGHVAPSNRLSVGFIGLGKQMGWHLGDGLDRRDVQVTALCDVESIRLGMQQRRVDKFYADRLGKGSYTGCAAYKNFQALMDRRDIDAVVICTPDHWHALLAVAALKSGKDVYCEKPLTLAIGEGRYIINAVRKYGRVFQTGSQQRTWWNFRKACELVRNGRIGKVHTVYVNVGGPPIDCNLPAQPVPEGLDWDMWLGPAPWRPYNADIAPGLDFPGWPNFRSYRDYAGGGMTDIGAHHFDIAQWGLGMDGSGPVEIHPPDGKDYKLLTYTYANGVILHHTGGHPDAGIEWVGSEGRLRVQRGDYLQTDPPELLDAPLTANDIRLYDADDHHTNFYECIRSRKRCICDAEIGHSSVTVCHLGNLAYWLKRPLKWDPVAEQFPGDDEANRLLLRPMRSPWRLA